MASAANGPYFPDPFRHDRSITSTFWNAILATALFRCWHILIFFGAWSTTISYISHNVKDLGIASTLLTVFVTMLFFFCLGDFD
jgi:putative membrane protein